ncbi:MAG: ABC transporter ATP-binding protein [Phycisphaerales bacterium JB043]
MTLEVRGVTTGYKRGREVLRGVSCRVDDGAMTAIVGPNGAGKSTLLRVMAGVMEVWDGEVVLAGEAIGMLSGDARARMIAYAGQRVSEGLSLTVREVVGIGRFGEGADVGTVERTLARFGLVDLAESRTDRLSVGQQQRVSIARAMAQLGEEEGARYVILDEPIASMDPRFAIGTMEELRRSCERGVGVCVVLHDLAMVTRWADRVVLMDGRGRVVREGVTDDVMCPDALREVYGIGMMRVDTPAGAVLMPMQDGGDRMEAP